MQLKVCVPVAVVVAWAATAEASAQADFFVPPPQTTTKDELSDSLYDDTKRLACMAASGDFLHEHPALEQAREAFAKDIDVVLLEKTDKTKITKSSYPADGTLLVSYQQACEEAGGVFDVFCGVSDCVEDEGKLISTDVQQNYANCFAPGTACSNYTAASFYLHAKQASAGDTQNCTVREEESSDGNTAGNSTCKNVHVLSTNAATSNTLLPPGNATFATMTREQADALGDEKWSTCMEAMTQMFEQHPALDTAHADHNLKGAQLVLLQEDPILVQRETYSNDPAKLQEFRQLCEGAGGEFVAFNVTLDCVTFDEEDEGMRTTTIEENAAVCFPSTGCSNYTFAQWRIDTMRHYHDSCTVRQQVGAAPSGAPAPAPAPAPMSSGIGDTVYNDDTKRVACLQATGAFETVHPALVEAAEAFAKDIYPTLLEKTDIKTVTKTSYPDGPLLTNYQQACDAAGGVFSVFCGVSDCVGQDGEDHMGHLSTDAQESYANCFAPDTACSDYTTASFYLHNKQGPVSAGAIQNCTLREESSSGEKAGTCNVQLLTANTLFAPGSSATFNPMTSQQADALGDEKRSTCMEAMTQMFEQHPALDTAHADHNVKGAQLELLQEDPILIQRESYNTDPTKMEEFRQLCEGAGGNFATFNGTLDCVTFDEADEGLRTTTIEENAATCFPSTGCSDYTFAQWRIDVMRLLDESCTVRPLSLQVLSHPPPSSVSTWAPVPAPMSGSDNEPELGNPTPQSVLTNSEASTVKEEDAGGLIISFFSGAVFMAACIALVSKWRKLPRRKRRSGEHEYELSNQNLDFNEADFDEEDFDEELEGSGLQMSDDEADEERSIS